MSEKITVDKGETLWQLAEDHLGDPKKWIDLFVKNQKVLAKRVYVRAGTELELPEPGFDPSANFNPSANE